MLRAGVPFRLLKDQLGSVRLVVNATTGVVAQRLDYDEFGRVLQDTAPGFQPFGFAGGLYDPDTGLVRFGARDYDPETGRWAAKDPTGFRGAQNLYAYCGDDPINRVDPDGKRPLSKSEAAFLDGYFGSSLDTSVIDLGYSLGARSWSPYGNRISLEKGLWKYGQVNLSDPYAASVFAHEALHVWQRQNSRWVTTEGAFLQGLYSAGLFDPYDYTRSIRADDIMLNQFLNGNVEQQGQMFQDYVYGIEIGTNVKKYNRIADFVRRQTIGESNACFE
jgi:RHS repeat-associated protein